MGALSVVVRDEFRQHRSKMLDEQHLASVLTEFVSYYNQERPHRTLGLQTPKVKPRPAAVADMPVGTPPPFPSALEPSSRGMRRSEARSGSP
jgi:Integrase core domain